MLRFDALPDNVKGALVLVCATFFLTIVVALVKLVGERLPVVQILFIRQLIMLTILIPALSHNFPSALKTKRPGLQLLRVGLAIIAMMGGFTAVVHMPLADATAIGFAKSFFITLFAILVLKEKVGPYRWAAVVVGFIGVGVMLQPGTSGYSIYGIFALSGAAAAGLIMVIIRMLTKTESSTSIMGFQVFGVGLIMMIPAFTHWVKPTLTEWLLIIVLGTASFVAQRLNIFAYKHGEASLLASLDYVRLLFATILGLLLFGQFPQLSTWIGAGIIIAASVFTVYREARRKQTLTLTPGARGFNDTQ